MSKLKKHTHLKPLEDIMSEGFGRYAKYIIQDRALPDVRDGLKPVQRRIIYAMNSLQLFYDRPHKKSARTVGEVIGKYHPHGDSSIYEAMVRMSQSWKNNIPLLDMHGNNGSVDGDSAAAMRYTECRLSQFGQMMADNIKKETVKFINNFDDSEIEPTVLPTMLPNLLINGASGIAAGYATNIPTYNPAEVIDAVVARIDKPDCSMKEIMKIMPGPDFPTGGIILNREGIEKAYETGKGKITVRAVIKLIENKAYITEIPYETNKSQIIRAIDELREQYDVLHISEVRDETDKHGLCIALDMKKTDNFDFVKNFLYKNTQLQISYSINMVAIKDRKPFLMPMLFTLDAFIDHINEIVIRAARFDLKKTETRREIVAGLIKAVKMLDDVISLIRRSSDKATAKELLMNKLMFSDIQAEAIVNLRLYRLSSTDVSALTNEANELEKMVSDLKSLLENKIVRDNYIKNKLRSYKEVFIEKRKTKFSNDDEKIIIDENDVVEDKEQIIIITRDGYLKNVPKKSFASSNYEELMLKEKDLPVAQFISNQREKVVLITSKGNYISIPTHKIEITKWREMGSHLNSVIEIDAEEKVIHAFNFDNNPEDPRTIVIASRSGQIKRTLVKDLGIGKNAKLSRCMSLEENDTVVSAFVLDNTSEQKVCAITEQGVNLVFPIEQISLVSKNAGGVRSINIKNDDKLSSVFHFESNNNYVALVCDKGIKRFQKNAFTQGSRGNVGRNLFQQNSSKSIRVLGCYEMSSGEAIHVIGVNDKWNVINVNETPLMTQGAKFVASHGDDIVFAKKIKSLSKEESKVVEKEEIISLFDDEKK